MGRRDTVWQNRTGGYIETTNPLGYDVLINGTNKYLNFATVSGSSGYGFRDNAGTMEFKDSGGAWAAFGSGGGGTPGGALTSIQYNNAGAFGGFGTWDGSIFTVGGDLSATNVYATLGLSLGAVNTEIKSSTLGVWTVVSNDGDEANIDANNLTADRTYTLPDATGTIALTSDLSSYVPYTGAIGAVDLGANNLTVDTNTLFVDATNNRVGVGTISPSSQLTIKGNNDATVEVAGSTAGRRGLFTYNNAPAVFELDVDTNFRLKTGSNYAIYATNGTVTIGAASAAVGTLRIPVAPTASANYGLVNLGSGAFDGATAGFFTGSANGTLIAGNLASGSTSDLLNLQIAGVSKFTGLNNGTFIAEGYVRVGGSTSGINLRAISSTVLGLRNNADGAYVDLYTGLNISLRGTNGNITSEAGNLGLYPANSIVGFMGTTSSFPAIKRNAAAINFRVADDSSDASITALTGTFSGGVKIGATQDLTWLTRAAIQASASGKLLLTDSAYTDFVALQFGGTTSSFPSLKRSTTSLEVRLADDSAYTRINALNFNGVALVTGGTATKYLSEDGTYTTPAGGAGLTNWTEAYGAGTQATSSFTATNAAANVNAALVAKGTGATVAQVPDGTATAGNSRGQYATDWQKIRNTNDMVASGNYSTIGGGERNKVVGSWATVAGGYNNRAAAGSSTVTGGESNNISAGSAAVIGGGSSNVSTQDYTFIGGGISNSITGAYGVIAGGNTNTVSATNAIVSGGSTNTASGQNSGVSNGFYAEAHLYGERVFAAGRFGALGDAQAPDLLWRREITGTSATELFLDGASVQAILKSGNTVWNAKIQVVATTSSIGNGGGAVGNSFSGEYLVSIKRLGATTSLVGTVQTIATTADTNMTASVVTITADDTNEALKITFTPDGATAGTTTVTRVVARGTIAEVRY